MTAPVPAVELARTVIGGLLEAGITEFVVAPGSRNAPLSSAAFDAAASGAARLHTRIDERTAGFLALGLTHSGGRAAVITTSGTAVANLHPALAEAAHSGVSMVALTADRPARLRGTTANQTTNQVGIFGALIPTHDIAADGAALAGCLALVSANDLPVHLNVQLDEPLLDSTSWAPAPAPVRRRRRSDGVAVTLPAGPRTVVVAGNDSGYQGRHVAEHLAAPLCAEPASGSRTGGALRTYRLLLGTALGAEIERVVVVGRPTLSRPVSRLLARDDVEVVAVPGRGAWAAHPFPVAREVDDVEGEPGDPAWQERWHAADAEVSRRLDALLAAEPDLTPYEVAGAVNRAVPPEGLLVVGPSNPIRDLDLMARPYSVGQRRKVIANRGLSGIDGVLSTAIGAALARRDTSRALAFVGDVTFLHDSNALILGPAEARPDLTIVVVNDDGGSIFSVLEQGAEPYADRFEALFGTPHGVDLAALCAATRTPHWQVESLPELEQALASPPGGIDVVEVRVRRDNRRQLDERIRDLAAEVVGEVK